MKVPESIRRVYELFPLVTFSDPKRPEPSGILYLYNIDTIDPDCLLAQAILTRAEIPFTVQEASPYITRERKLPVYYSDSKAYFIGDIIERFVPESERREVDILALADSLKNAYFCFVAKDKVVSNFETTKDQGRLWPVNRAIEHQVVSETETLKGFFETSKLKLRVALCALNELVYHRRDINFTDLVIYSNSMALDSIMELPHELQHHMLRVAGCLEPRLSSEEITIEVSEGSTPELIEADEGTSGHG